MSKKKAMILALSAVLLLSMLAGCTKKATPDTSTNSTAAATAAQTEAPTDAATAASTEAPKAEPVKIVMERPLWGTMNPESAPNMRIKAKVLEKTNIDVTIVGQLNPNDQSEKPNLMIAAGESLDIFQTPYISGMDWRKYKDQGVIIPLNDLLDKYGQDLLKNVDPLSWKAVTDADGKIWALPEEQPPLPVILEMRKDWLDKAGLAVPNTFAEFENVLQVFKDKFKDEGFTPVWQNNQENYFLGSFIPTGDQRFVDTDGKLKPPFMAPGFKDYLAKMAEWYKKGFLHKEYASMTYQQAMDKENAGRVGLKPQWVANTYKGDVDALRKNVPDGDLIMVAPPIGPAGRMMSKGLSITSNIMITKSSKNPEAAMKFINYANATDEGFMLSGYGEEGTDWTWIDQANKTIKRDGPADQLPDYIFRSTALLKFTSSITKGAVKEYDSITPTLDETKYPSTTPIDLFVNYDINKMKSKDQINSLNTMIQEAKDKIIMGQMKLSDWDGQVQKWLKAGGQQYIDDYTEQFNAQK